MWVKSFIQWFFLYKFSRQQISYFLSATIVLGVLACAFSYLEVCGGRHVFLTFIPLAVKVFIAQTIEVVAVIAVVYFIVRFILGFFIDKEDKESPELQAINQLKESIDKLPEAIAKAIKSSNGSP